MSTPKKKTRSKVQHSLKLKNPVKLPRSFMARKLVKHPMLLARDTNRITDLARSLGIKHNSIITAEQYAMKDRDYPLPASWVRVYCEATDLPPYVFRPDLFMPNWAYPNTKGLGA